MQDAPPHGRGDTAIEDALLPLLYFVSLVACRLAMIDALLAVLATTPGLSPVAGTPFRFVMR